MTTENSEAAASPRRRVRMTWKKWLILGLAVVVVLGAAGVGAFLLLRPNAGAAAQAFSRTETVAKGTQTLTVSVDGTLSPRKQSELNFGVSGTVTKVYVKAGDKVAKGDKLARIDADELDDAVDLAQAKLTTAKANLSEVYDNDGSSAAIKSAKAQVSSAKAELASAQQDLTDAVLRSTVTGTVASVDLEVGDTVSGSGSSAGSGGGSSASATSSSSGSSSSSAQFVVISTSTWKLEGSVGSADLPSLKAGQSADITTDAGTETIKGTVASVGIVATSTSDGSATFPIVINLSGSHTDLYSGTTASAVITTGSYPDVLTVPTAAIASSDGKTVVTKVSDGQTSQVEVEIGRVFGDYTEITSGLAEGDQVQITFTRRASGTSTSSSESEPGFGIDMGGMGGGGMPPGGSGGMPPGGGAAGGNR